MLEFLRRLLNHFKRNRCTAVTAIFCIVFLDAERFRAIWSATGYGLKATKQGAESVASFATCGTLAYMSSQNNKAAK